MTRVSPRTLTESEVELVRRWARRNRFVLWLLLPIATAVIFGLAGFGIASVLDGHWLLGGIFTLLSPLVAFALLLTWRSMRAYGEVHTTTPVETRRGELRHKRIGKSFTLAIGNLAVVFVNRDVRRAVKLGDTIVAEVVMGAPVLVVTARANAEPE